MAQPSGCARDLGRSDAAGSTACGESRSRDIGLHGYAGGMDASLRPAHRNDVPAMMRVRHSVTENRLVSRVIIEDEVIDAIERTGRGWVIEIGADIVGFAIADAATGSIWALFVDPACERRGYGRRLLDECVGWLFANTRVSRIWLTTDPQTRAHRFYLKAGWQETGRAAHGELRLELARAVRQASQAP